MPSTEADSTPKELNLRQKAFCELFASDREFFGNGTQSYIEAYDIDTNKKGAYASARTSAYELLTKPDILKRIDELLELNGLNDQSVDKELNFLVIQKADFGSKLGAIREYNKLKQRVADRMEHTGRDGGPIETTTLTYMPKQLPDDYYTRNQADPASQ